MSKVRKRGIKHHPLYNVYAGMKARCNNKTHVAYHRYGGRGIKVCKRWLDVEHGFRNFVNDMYPSFKEGLELDRENNNKGYSKSNCRWVTRTTNLSNKRNNVVLIIRGKRYTMAQAARAFHVSKQAIYYRLKAGYSHQACVDVNNR